ncbi:MAG: DHH family phosphoesterase, partial [Pseudobdellovibrio sp.]
MPRWKERINKTPKLVGPFPDLISRILSSRGLTQENLEDLLTPKLTDLKEPLAMKGMKEAVDRIVRAYKNNEKICIYADFDLDGTSGLAILKHGLEKIGFKDVAFYQPKRLSEGYGFHAEAVEELVNVGITLIITVDVGITSFKAFEK